MGTQAKFEIRFGGDDQGFTIAEVGSGPVVCEYYPPAPDPRLPELARFIVRACNCHDDLLAACKEAAYEFHYSAHSSGDPSDPTNMDGHALMYRKLHAAISKATSTT